MKNLFFGYSLWLATAAFGQSASCDSICAHPEFPAEFTPGNHALLEFITDSIIPVIAMESDSITDPPGKLYILLTIDHEGNVTDAQFPSCDLPESCQTALRNRYRSMKGWSPARSNGKPVCSTKPFPITCILWTR